MADYRYVGRDRSGRQISGQLSAESKANAVSTLKGKGIATTEIHEFYQSVLSKEISLSNGIKPRDLVIFLRQFASLLEAGISVVQSVHILEEQTVQRALKRALASIQLQVKEGESLSNAMQRQEKCFPPMVIQLTRVGEASGNLDDAMNRLADYFEKRYEMKQKIISALTYPALLGFVSIAVLNVMLYLVIPQFTSMYVNTEKELPELTQWVIAISSFGNRYWWLMFLVIMMLVVGILVCLKNATSRMYLEYAILKVPILGQILQKTLIIEFSRTLSSLFTSSVPILQSMAITRNVIKNSIFKRMIGQAILSVEEGNSMTVPMKDQRLLPPLVIHMIHIGEQTGNLDKMLFKITKFYEAEVEHITDRLRSLLEPIMILILSIVVGVIVLSVVLPMFDLYQNINL